MDKFYIMINRVRDKIMLQALHIEFIIMSGQSRNLWNFEWKNQIFHMCQFFGKRFLYVRGNDGLRS